MLSCDHRGNGIRVVVSEDLTTSGQECMCRKRTFCNKTRHFELLTVEHDDEEPDEGTKEGSGDDYEE